MAVPIAQNGTKTVHLPRDLQRGVGAVGGLLTHFFWLGVVEPKIWATGKYAVPLEVESIIQFAGE